METELRNNFELAANIWPIINSTSGLIRRIAARAYVLPSGDGDLISDTLSFLGKTDFMIAKEYPLGSDFKTITKEGELSGCVSAATFMFDTERIIRPILEALSNEHPEIGEIVLNIFQSRETL